MKIYLRRHHALRAGDGAFSQKIDYVTLLWDFLNIEGHPHRITGSRVMAILLNGCILAIGGASAVEGLRSTGLVRRVYYKAYQFGSSQLSLKKLTIWGHFKSSEMMSFV